MKTIYILMAIALVMISEYISAQTPIWDWARSATGDEYDEASTVAADSRGNIYIAGYFTSDDLDFGEISIENAAPGFNDLFLAGYDSTGLLRWVQRAGGSSNDRANSVTTDKAGNIYLTGSFYSPEITFGKFTLTNTSVVSDIFVVKYDIDGNVLWAKSEGGAGVDIPYAIAADDENNIMVAGRFSSLSITFGTTILTLTGGNDAFIVKYDPSGNVVWAKNGGGTSLDEAYALDTDSDENIYMSGFFNQHATFENITLTTEGQADMFVVRYDKNGEVIWAKSAGGSGDDRAQAVSVDAEGNSYITGFFNSPSITFGSTTLFNYYTEGIQNSFIAKFDKNGNPLWAKAINGKSNARGIALTSGNVFVCGYFNDDILTYGPSTLAIEGNSDIFLANCDTSGNALWAIKQTSGGESSDFANAITADPYGKIYVAGDYGSYPIVFGTSILTTIDSDKSFDIFLAKMGSSATGITELTGINNLKIYPNPSSGAFTASYNSPVSGICNIKMIDSMGRDILKDKVYALQNGLNEFRIETSGLQKGIYFLLIEPDKTVFIGKKLVIE